MFSDDIEEHEAHLCEVLRRLNRFHLCIQPPKCLFFRKSVPYIGHIVSEMVIRIAGTRVAELNALPRPQTGKQMQSFLGVVNFLRAFIPSLAMVAAPLDALRTAKYIDLGDPSVWTQDCESAFNDIKDAVKAAPMLSKPQWDEPFSIATDASNVRVGAV